MSNREEREAEDNYEAENDASPVTGDITDNSYLRETRGVLRADDQLPVIPDQADYDDPMQPPYSNSNEQLGMYMRFVQLRLLSPLAFAVLSRSAG